MKRRVLVGGIIAVVVLAGGGYAAWYYNGHNSKKAKVKKAAQAQIEATVLKDYDTDSVDKILKLSISDEDKYSQLYTSGQLKGSVQKYADAISYYKAAAGMKEILDSQRIDAQYKVVLTARQAKDSATENAYAAKIGADKLKALDNPPKLGSEGE